MPGGDKKRTMFLGADRFIFRNAAVNRSTPTHSEMLLWEQYLRHKPLGYKFRRQHPIGIYIADFYCHALKLVVEVDGSIHNLEEVMRKDMEKQAFLVGSGLIVLRFTCRDIERRMGDVIKGIEEFMPPNPLKGEL